jgi:hypothetical protein
MYSTNYTTHENKYKLLLQHIKVLHFWEWVSVEIMPIEVNFNVTVETAPIKWFRKKRANYHLMLIDTKGKIKVNINLHHYKGGLRYSQKYQDCIRRGISVNKRNTQGVKNNYKPCATPCCRGIEHVYVPILHLSCMTTTTGTLQCAQDFTASLFKILNTEKTFCILVYQTITMMKTILYSSLSQNWQRFCILVYTTMTDSVSQFITTLTNDLCLFTHNRKNLTTSTCSSPVTSTNRSK